MGFSKTYVTTLEEVNKKSNALIYIYPNLIHEGEKSGFKGKNRGNIHNMSSKYIIYYKLPGFTIRINCKLYYKFG